MSGSLPETRRVWTVATAPGIFPFVGHGITLFRNPLPFLNSVSSYGDLVEIRLGPQRAWLVCHPELVHRVLMDARTFDKGGPQYDRLRPLMGNGLVTCAHEDHRRQRKLIQPAFHAARIADCARVMGEEAESVLGAWRPGERVDVSGAMLALTTRVTSRFLLSDALDAATVAELRDCLAALVRGLFVRTVVPLAPLFRLPTPANRRYRRAFDRLHAIVDSVIDERRRGRPRDDLLGSLLEAERGHGGAAVTGREIHDQLITLLLTGVESTAMCLGSLFALLPRHPEAERRLHAEVDEVLAEGRPPGQEELTRLVYTRGVVTETLRVYPPGWLFTRTTTKETDLAGVRLPRGTTVLYSPYVLHHDPASFPDPDRFLPERWLPGQSAAVRNGALLPFAAGSRKCVGDAFAMAEATLAVATVARRWRLRPLPGHVEQPRPAATLGPRALEMICESRSQTPPGKPPSQASGTPDKDGAQPFGSPPEVVRIPPGTTTRSPQEFPANGTVTSSPRNRRREGDKHVGGA
ncbi:cytochrome P450 [Streptomyces cynarae]|uniref:Cytochrome P450 n=1 Tax=Streptomyces cynarae TaxID=2981134 RepID=A0ABY6DUZ0_9ACTN|nr:cytochrome P450 [Streptomyces cynarae]UXY18184.1 cytochrome P450 [Streptomyces cynarae]